MNFSDAVEEKELHKLFMEDVDSYIRDFHEGIMQIRNGKGASDLLRLLHTLKSNAASAGFSLIASFSHELEQGLIPYHNKAVFPDSLCNTLENAQNIIRACFYTKDHSTYRPLVRSLIDTLRRILENSIQESIKKTHPQDSTNINTDVQSVVSKDQAIKERASHQISISIKKDEEFPVLSAMSILNILKEHALVLSSTPNVFKLSQDDSISEFCLDVVYSDTISSLYKIISSQAFVESVNIVSLQEEGLAELEKSNKDDTIKINLNNFKKLEGTTTELFEQKQQFNDFLSNLFDVLQSHNVLEQTVRQYVDISTVSLINTRTDKEFVTNSVYNINAIMQKLSIQIQHALLEFYERIFASSTLINEQSYNIGRSVYNLWRLSAKVQLLPIQELFNLLPKIVATLSKTLKKNVAITFEGGSIMLDTSLLSRIHSSIAHCIRNSIDHGIETEHIRRERNKNPQGSLVIRASNIGRYLKIDCIDDGAGIDINKLQKVAIKKGYLKADNTISDKEALELLFIPGLSTADSVSMVSGRGMGMDIVKIEIEDMGGNISIHSNPGKGTEISLLIPLNMSLITCVIVRIHEERLAIPFFYILEILSANSISVSGNSWEYKGKSIPFLNLNEIYYGKASLQHEMSYIIVCEAEEECFAIHIEDIVAYQEVVVKSLHTKSLPKFILGTSTMVDGGILLVVDLPVLFQDIKKKPLQTVQQGMR